MVVQNRSVRVLVVALVIALVVVPYVPVGAWPLPDTGSMEPTLGGCDLLLYGPADDVDVGDVVIFDAPWRDGLVIHRVVGETSAGYVTRGDANPVPDPEPVPRGRVVAEVHQAVGTGQLVGDVCDPVSDAAMTAFESSSDHVYR